MCYSGKCRWERYMGDCGFPTIKEIREKYKYPLCEMDISNEEEYLYTNEAIKDVENMLKNYLNKSNHEVQNTENN